MISVITINFNNLEPLKITFESVISQTNQNIEYIIIDGGSQDGTVNFLQENNSLINYWSSEPDRGIYDAMNKGVQVATGEWVIFMNSGDLFYNEQTIEKIIPYLNNISNNRSPDVVYGMWESISNDKYGCRSRIDKPASLDIIWHQIPACHQSVFVRRELLSRYPFDTSLKWCADHDLLAHLYQLGHNFLEVPVTIAKFDAGGDRARGLLTYTKERWSIYRRYFEKTFERELYFINEYRSFWIQENINKRIRQLLPVEWIVASRKLRKLY